MLDKFATILRTLHVMYETKYKQFAQIWRAICDNLPPPLLGISDTFKCKTVRFYETVCGNVQCFTVLGEDCFANCFGTISFFTFSFSVFWVPKMVLKTTSHRKSLAILSLQASRDMTSLETHLRFAFYMHLSGWSP